MNGKASFTLYHNTHSSERGNLFLRVVISCLSSGHRAFSAVMDLKSF